MCDGVVHLSFEMCCTTAWYKTRHTSQLESKPGVLRLRSPALRVNLGGALFLDQAFALLAEGH